MRFVPLFATALVGCTGTSFGAITVQPEAAVLGLDLTERYGVTQERCETGYDSDGCTNVTPDALTVAVDAGTAVELGAVTPGMFAGVFDLTGVATGTSTIRVGGDDDITRTVSVTVAAVDTTTMFAQRKPPEGGFGLPDVPGPVQAFTATQIAIGQTSVAADQTKLVGASALELVKGATELAAGPECTCYLIRCDCFTTGTIPGAAQLIASRGTLDINVVDASAIARFTMDDSSTITLDVGKGSDLGPVFLTPSDSAGRPIVGRGPTPTLTVDDPTIATATFDDTITVGRALSVHGVAIGTTALRLTWGTAELELVVSVVAP